MASTFEGRVWIDDNDDGIKNAAESYNGKNGLTVSVISRRYTSWSWQNTSAGRRNLYGRRFI